MALTQLENIINLLRPGVDSVFGQYSTYGQIWGAYGYVTKKSNMSYETQVEMQYPGMASLVAEATNIPYTTNVGQRFVTTYRHKKIAISFGISAEAIADNLYQNQFPEQMKSNLRSLNEAKNVLSSDVLNNAFRYDQQFLLGDGQPLASTQHPYFGGVYANTFPANSPAIDFSEYGLEQALIVIQKFPDQAGLLANVKPRKIIVPLQKQFAARRLLKSAYTPGSANNAVNAIFDGNYFPDGFMHSPYLVNPDAWFITTDAENGLTHFSREAVKHNMFPNFTNETITYTAVSRDSWGISNPRGVFCAA